MCPTCCCTYNQLLHCTTLALVVGVQFQSCYGDWLGNMWSWEYEWNQHALSHFWKQVLAGILFLITAYPGYLNQPAVCCSGYFNSLTESIPRFHERMGIWKETRNHKSLNEPLAFHERTYGSPGGYLTLFFTKFFKILRSVGNTTEQGIWFFW